MTLAAEQRTLRLIKQSTHTCPAAGRFDFRIIAATKPQFNLGLGRRWSPCRAHAGDQRNRRAPCKHWQGQVTRHARPNCAPHWRLARISAPSLGTFPGLTFRAAFHWAGCHFCLRGLSWQPRCAKPELPCGTLRGYAHPHNSQTLCLVSYITDYRARLRVMAFDRYRRPAPQPAATARRPGRAIAQRRELTISGPSRCRRQAGSPDIWPQVSLDLPAVALDGGLLDPSVTRGRRAT
jgi:hypothetical protein